MCNGQRQSEPVSKVASLLGGCPENTQERKSLLRHLRTSAHRYTQGSETSSVESQTSVCLFRQQRPAEPHGDTGSPIPIELFWSSCESRNFKLSLCSIDKYNDGCVVLDSIIDIDGVDHESSVWCAPELFRYISKLCIRFQKIDFFEYFLN